MTIPDIGHCAGSGAEPARESIQHPSDGTTTGVCPAWYGRFELHPSGAMSLHDAAEVDQREAVRVSTQTDFEAEALSVSEPMPGLLPHSQQREAGMSENASDEENGQGQQVSQSRPIEEELLQGAQGQQGTQDRDAPEEVLPQ